MCFTKIALKNFEKFPLPKKLDSNNVDYQSKNLIILQRVFSF